MTRRSTLLLLLFVLVGNLVQGKDKYFPGYYLDAGNNKVAGFIYFNESNYDHFYFRAEPGGRESRIVVDQCNGFSYNNRNFVVLEDVHWQSSLWRNHARRAFAELLVDGPVKLYCVYREVNQPRPLTAAKSGMIATVGCYLLRKEGDYTYMALADDEFKFRHQLAEYLKDNDALSQQLLKQDSSTVNLAQVIVAYNKGAGLQSGSLQDAQPGGAPAGALKER
ncbi:hypothetical protein DCC81_17025 [Chitinophaga parva]|uniref:Uncharacterized protein n=1 Tax=Chitinophaga parva TaxID=2169414 RepID=A0A2T7BI34_9BACT|nr:hypothetical protein [Chitinophaga parva]PUZ25947.1 hypothetical protein DCC81_17025 [Chitinophaga parva]